MTTLQIRRALVTALAALALPAAAHAQQRPQPVTARRPAPAPAAQEVQGWLTELRQIHGKLEAIQRKALQDPGMAASQDALGASIKAAMEKADPTLARSMARVQALETEAAAAQKAKDQAKLKQLTTEAQQIQRRFLTAQQAALKEPGLAGKVESFQKQLERRMASVDPQAPQLMARFQELQSRLASTMQPGAQR